MATIVRRIVDNWLITLSNLQPELIVNYCKLVVISVDDPILSRETRDGMDVTFPFLSDSEKEDHHPNWISTIQLIRTMVLWQFLTRLFWIAIVLSLSTSIRDVSHIRITVGYCI